MHCGVLDATSTFNKVEISFVFVFCIEPENCPPPQKIAITIPILTLSFKANASLNPLCKGFVLSHFEQLCGTFNIVPMSRFEST